MNKQIVIILLCGLIVLLIFYILVDAKSHVPQQQWGKFQLLHDEQVEKLSGGKAENQSNSQIYKWIVNKNN